MLALPWKKDASSDELLEEEVNRLLAIMRDSKVDSEEYKTALIRYRELHEHSIKEKSLCEARRSRWFDFFGTLGICTLTLTAEQWTPLTSKWFNHVMHPIRTRRGEMFF